MSLLFLVCTIFSTTLLAQEPHYLSGESPHPLARPIPAQQVQSEPAGLLQAGSGQGHSSTPVESHRTRAADTQAQNAKDKHTKAQNIKDKNEVLQILDSLEKVMGELKDSNHRVKNLKKVLVVLESGKVRVGDEDKVKANKAVRILVITGLRSLRASARQIGSEIRITVLPKKRGLLSKLRARRELIQDKPSQVRYDRMIGQMNQEITLIEQQAQILQTNLKGLSAAISLMEGQLDFLDMVQESIQLGQKVGEQLRELNKELDQVVDRLVRNQLGQ